MYRNFPTAVAFSNLGTRNTSITSKLKIDPSKCQVWCNSVFFLIFEPKDEGVSKTRELVKSSFSLVKPSLNCSMSRGPGAQAHGETVSRFTRQAPGGSRVEAGAGNHRSSGLPMVSMWMYHPEVDSYHLIWDFQRDSHKNIYLHIFVLTCPYYINSGHYIYIYTYVRTYIQSHA